MDRDGHIKQLKFLICFKCKSQKVNRNKNLFLGLFCFILIKSTICTYVLKKLACKTGYVHFWPSLVFF